MVGYRCYVLDAAEHIVQAHDLDCDGDMQAQVEAENFLIGDPYHTYVEVWQATRKVGRLKRRAGTHLRLVRPASRALRPATVLP